MRSGSVQSSLICPIFRKDFRGSKGGEAQRAKPEEKKTPFRIRQTAYGFSTPFSEEPQGNGYKTNKPGKRKREKPLPSTAARSFRSPLRHALRTASYGARHSAPSTPRTTVPTSGQPYAIGLAPAPNPPPEFPNGEKNTNRHVLTTGSATGSNSVSKKHTGKPSCLAVRGHPRRPGPQPGPCIFRHRAFRIGGNQAFASLRPKRWASRSIHPISTTPNTILSANSTLMFRFLSRTFSAMKPACNRMMTIVP